jgi:IS605 OrfB family transposase
MREDAGQYRAVVTLDEPVAGEAVRVLDGEVIAGIDLNLDHLAIVMVDQEGQFRRWRVMRYANLGELPKAKTRWMMGNLAKQAIAWAKAQGAQVLVIEDLDLQPAGDTRAQNRRTVPFAYRQLTQALERRALREGLQVKRVNPAYTSWMGQLKYSDQDGISTHIAAAYVIGRRGLGLEERIPADPVARFDAIAAEIETTKAGPAQKRAWQERLEDWKHHSPEAGHPWRLWATLKGVSDASNGRGRVTWGRNDLPWRRCSAGNIRPGVEPASRAGPTRSEIALSGTVVERQHARPQDKACGPYADEAAF